MRPNSLCHLPHFLWLKHASRFRTFFPKSLGKSTRRVGTNFGAISTNIWQNVHFTFWPSNISAQARKFLLGTLHASTIVSLPNGPNVLCLAAAGDHALKKSGHILFHSIVASQSIWISEKYFKSVTSILNFSSYFSTFSV